MARSAPRHHENRPISGVDRDALTDCSFKSLCGAKHVSTGALLRKLIFRGNFFQAIADDPQLSRLPLFPRCDGEAAESLTGFWQFFALDTSDNDAAIVAEQLCVIAAGGREQRFGSKILQVASGNRRWRVAALEVSTAAGFDQQGITGVQAPVMGEGEMVVGMTRRVDRHQLQLWPVPRL